MLRMPENMESAAGLHNVLSQSELGTQVRIDGSTSFTPNKNDLEPAKYGIDRIAAHRGMGQHTEYKVRCYGYGPK